MTDKPIPSQPRRRSFLKRSLAGAGTAVALPWLNSLPVRSEESGKLAVGDQEKDGPPTRFGCIFFSNGVEPEHWWAKKESEGVRFGKGLEPLQQHSRDITFLKGLFNEQADKHPSPHMGRMANFLSGAWISRDQSEIRAGQSMDQFLANTVGRETELPSLALGVEPTELRLEDGLSMIYGSCISWASETQPATKEIYPARVYDQITGAGGDRKMDRSILDAVAAEANRVRKQVSSSESAKLDEYFESIRSIERRIDKAGKEQSLEGWQPSASEPTFARPNEALPQNVAEHMRLMLDLIILAFQMDKTRIATCMLNNDLSQMNFGFLEGVEGSLHLDLTHNGREPELEAMYLRTNQFHCQQLGYLIERMKKIDEGGASLWDNSILLFGSNLFDGDRHQGSEMPLLLTGGAGSSLAQGRIIDVSNSAIEDRRACNLYLSLMDKMGVTLPRFGDSNKRLPI